MRATRSVSILQRMLYYPENGLFPPNSNKLLVLAERQLKSEDKAWDRFMIPTLRHFCLQTLAEAMHQGYEVINQLNEKDKRTLLQLLPTSLPLHISAVSIDDDAYWRRCCKDNDFIIYISNCNGQWKRAFMEVYVTNCVQRFDPNKDNIEELKTVIRECAPFIKKLCVEQLKQKKSENFRDIIPKFETLEELENNKTAPTVQTCKCVQFSVLLPLMKKLQNLSVCYTVQDCGPSFEWDFIKMSSADCDDFCMGLKTLDCLNSLSICRSCIDDTLMIKLGKALENNKTIQILDLSHNDIEDLGVKACAKLITSLHQLKEFGIANNKFGPYGAEYLAQTLVYHPTISIIDLSFNKLCEEGGLTICQALFQRPTFTKVSMACCRLGKETGKALKHVIEVNSQLENLDISNNYFCDLVGKGFVEALDKNSCITKLDVRLCEISEKYSFEIFKKLFANTNVDNPEFTQSFDLNYTRIFQDIRTVKNPDKKRDQSKTTQFSRSLLTMPLGSQKIKSSSSEAARSILSLKDAVAKVKSKMSITVE